jgi:DNA-binding transcriptional MocR family regulator
LLDELAVLTAAVKAKVSFDLGSNFRAQPSSKLALRLCYSAVPADDIHEGVARLAQAIDRVRRR